MRYWPDAVDAPKKYYVHNDQLVVNFVSVIKNNHFHINELQLVRKSADAVRSPLTEILYIRLSVVGAGGIMFSVCLCVYARASVHAFVHARAEAFTTVLPSTCSLFLSKYIDIWCGYVCGARCRLFACCPSINQPVYSPVNTHI